MTTENETNETTDAEKAAKLIAAGKKAEVQKKERQERVVKGSHLTSKLLDMANALVPSGVKLEDKSGFTKVTGATKGRSVYVAKKGGRVDISGFAIEADAVKQISEKEARDKHLGKVRGQLDFARSDDEVLAAFGAALEELSKPAPAKVKEAAAENAAEAKAS